MTTTAADTTAPTSTVWALGDYHTFAKATVWEIGPLLVAAARIKPGDQVLDVAAGTGNVAIRAAAAGAGVVALDVTPENFAAGRREAALAGVEVRWIEGDAEQLPFPDAAFDVVTSCFGVLFAGDQQRAAAEMVRVCRPGGTLVLANFAPQGASRAFFELLGRYLPVPPGPAPASPLEWGTADGLDRLLGGRLAELTVEAAAYVERAQSPEAYRRLFERTFGPVVALRAALASRPERAAAFDRDLAEYTVRWNSGAATAAEYRYPYVLVTATR